MEVIIKDRVVLIDECDYDLFSLGYRGIHSWSFQPQGYLRAQIGGKAVLFHRLVAARIGYEQFLHVDHINHNKVDNRRGNLRGATNAQNSRNKIKKGETSSKYKGVTWDKQNNKWRAAITVDYKSKKLGRFIEENDAARAYNEAAIMYFGEFALLNVIED